MLIGRIRPVEKRIIEVTETDLVPRLAAIDELTPEGWQLSSRITGEIVRRDGVEEIEADSMAALEAKVPAGWQLLGVYEA